MEKPASAESNYRSEIDGLRALAVIAVIFNHFDKFLLPGGYLGVDIFFVISGFVITGSLSGRPSNSFGHLLMAFYIRRIKRLVPALVLFVVIAGLMICVFDPHPGGTLATGVTALFGISNLYLFRESIDYFGKSTELNVFTHTWSLGVEEQFYVLFPVLIWLTGFSRQTRNGSRNLLWTVGSLSAASLAAFIYYYPTHQPATYFLMPTRLWELGAGCLLFVGSQKPNLGIRTISKASSLTVIAAIVGVLFIPFQFAVAATIAVVLLTVALIACLRKGSTGYSFFANRSVVYIGQISYSLYLWHWGVLSLSRWTIGIHWWTVPLQIALMVLLASFSYQYVETYCRRANWSVNSWRTIMYGMAASTGAAGLLIGLVKIPGLSLYVGQKPELIAVGVESLFTPYFHNATGTTWQGKRCIIAANSEVGKNVAIDACTLGDFSTAKKRVIVIGNSFSAAFTQAFDDIVAQDGYSVTISSSWGASPVETIPNMSAWDKANNYYWATVVPSLISRLEPEDWVFLVNDLAEFSPSAKFPNNSQRLRQLQAGLEILSDKLSQNGINLAVLHGLPFAREANCRPDTAVKQWFAPFDNSCPMPDKMSSLTRRKKLDEMLVSLSQRGKIQIVDLFSIFCPQKECTYFAENGQLLYRDEWSHPSVEAARLSSENIREVLLSWNLTGNHLFPAPSSEERSPASQTKPHTHGEKKTTR